MVMTTSIGISVFPDDGTTAEELLKHADLALYQSKGGGRNSLNFFNDSLKTRASIALQLEEELRWPCSRSMGCVCTTSQSSTCAASKWQTGSHWCAGNTRNTACSGPSVLSRSPKPMA